MPNETSCMTQPDSSHISRLCWSHACFQCSCPGSSSQCLKGLPLFIATNVIIITKGRFDMICIQCVQEEDSCLCSFFDFRAAAGEYEDESTSSGDQLLLQDVLFSPAIIETIVTKCYSSMLTPAPGHARDTVSQSFLIHDVQKDMLDMVESSVSTVQQEGVPI
ncbi:uncharacterized protein B0I36DRAFT_58174 [Microdochium trichocladiopsis]|uniref:Uncharacterized protein n=1 Tax=Microdochium trichocladiopsis TaxID=1682393 RepID=A0A9P9BKN1_9PEZI|nr:uncharacterized protein B0I36DRAFT_58174 [Microdochium trichocladiopsis]KAH7010668.1 hypothetical protein B0I36DRAFT_58174 [Microdochium trichocladiopsis]